MTEKLSASTASMGDLFVLGKYLLLSLADRDDPIDSGIKSFSLTLREEHNRRMGGLENNDMVVIPTFLDPRFKGKFFSPKYICDHGRRKVAEAAQYLNLEMGNSESNNVEPVSKRFKPPCGNDLMDIPAMLNNSEDEEIDGRRENTAIVVSIDQYVAEPRIPPEADLLHGGTLISIDMFVE